jgi:hypothetical protein
MVERMARPHYRETPKLLHLQEPSQHQNCVHAELAMVKDVALLCKARGSTVSNAHKYCSRHLLEVL